MYPGVYPLKYEDIKYKYVYNGIHVTIYPTYLMQPFGNHPYLSLVLWWIVVLEQGGKSGIAMKFAPYLLLYKAVYIELSNGIYLLVSVEFYTWYNTRIVYGTRVLYD